MAAAVLSTVWFAGEHHLVEAEDRPEDLPASSWPPFGRHRA
jgi:hypothetical protein